MNDVFRSFTKGTTTLNSMKRLREILHERIHEDIHEEDETGVAPCDEKYARYDTAFNEQALSNSKDDDSYAWEELGMSNDVTVWEADNVIANTGINPLMFEEGIDTEAWIYTLRLHEKANWFKNVKLITKEEMDKREEIESDVKENPHYRLMEVKRENNWSVRRFYWNWTEWYETWDEDDWNLDQEEWKNAEENRRKRNKKVAVQLLYKKLGESKAWMKQAFNQRHYKLADEFKKEFEYCSRKLDMLKECDEKIKQDRIKRRKNKLFDNYIKLCNLGCPITVEQVKKIINEKSLWYAEKVIESKISEWKLKNC